MNKLAILVGGGPAPGINAVIGAATIRARLEGIDVVGIRDGFEWIMQGDIDHVMPLSIDVISRIHFRGGSYLGIARANPTKDPALLDRTIDSLLRLGVSQLITIGGDDTAFSAMKLEARAAGRIRVVHVPKTIDNDLDLPPHVDTFGFQSARHYGVEIVKNLMVDAKTTSRWYFVIAMGRKAGHLALGIGKAAGATVTLITEEFRSPTRLKTIVDSLVGAIVKRLADGRRDGVAIIAEGVVLDVAPEDLEGLAEIERDAHGHLRLAEVDLGNILKAQVLARLRALGVKSTIAAKNIGYELRCADPIPFDMEYSRDLGYCAAEVPALGRERGDGVDAGRPLHPGAVLDDDRRRDRPHADPPRQHHLDALRNRAPLHDPAAPRRLRSSGGAVAPGGDGQAAGGRVPPAVRISRAAGTAAARHRSAGGKGLSLKPGACSQQRGRHFPAAAR